MTAALLVAAMFESAMPSPCPKVPHDVRATTSYYAGHEDAQALDLYAPVGAHGVPLAIYVHGGAWVSGDKRDYVQLGQAFARCGIAAAVINYPLAPQTPASQQAALLGQAVQWLRHNAERSGYDTKRIVLIGHSAGAQLCWYALAHKMIAPAVAGVVAIGAVGINPSRDVDDLDPQYQGIYAPAFGHDRTAWAQFDIGPRLHAGDPPSLVIHGQSDFMAPEAISRDLYNQLKAAGASVQFLQPLGEGHWDLIEALSRPGDQAMIAIERFILSVP